MKKIFLCLVAFASLSAFAQRDAVSQSSPAGEGAARVPCCAQCSGPNAHLNASIVVATATSVTCNPENGNGNSGQPWQVVYVRNCTNRVVPGHKACGGTKD